MVMKRIIFGCIIIALASCGNSNNNNLPVETNTATDTMTNITNPGVGAVSDDTSARD